MNINNDSKRDNNLINENNTFVNRDAQNNELLAVKIALFLIKAKRA